MIEDKKFDEFHKICEPVVKYMQDNPQQFSIHSTIIITVDGAKLVTDEMITHYDWNEKSDTEKISGKMGKIRRLIFSEEQEESIRQIVREEISRSWDKILDGLNKPIYTPKLLQALQTIFPD